MEDTQRKKESERATKSFCIIQDNNSYNNNDNNNN